MSNEKEAVELNESLKKFFNKAKVAVEKNNHTYAISLCQSVLKSEPAFLEARKLARSCAIHLSKSKKKKKESALGSFFSSGMSGMKFSSQIKKDPAAAMVEIEEALADDPFDETANDALHEASLRLGYMETAAFALETIRRGGTENTKLLHKLAEHYLERERADLAVEVYNDIVKRDPSDMEAVKGAKDASARATMHSQKWGKDQSMDSLRKDGGGDAKQEQNSKRALTRDQQFERLESLTPKYQEDPHNLNVVKQIAQIYEDLGDWENAHTYYDWAYQVSNSDVTLKNKAFFAGNKASEAHIADLQKQLEENPDNEEVKAELERIQSERSAKAIESAQRRVEENPTDPQVRYELGSAYYAAGQYSEAIPHLQQATRNPHIRTRVLLTLARAFDGKGMHDLAIKQLTDALADLNTMDNTKKEVLYEKGLIHAKMENKDEALSSFKEIYEVDYGYRDVATRVESSYQG